jgi:carbon storage regulator
MLVLSRKPGESVVIDGRIKVKIVRLEGDVVKIGIEAPPDVPIHRQEVYDEIQQSNKQALQNGRATPPRLPRKPQQHQPQQRQPQPQQHNKPISDRQPVATADLAA